jgi:alanyl-tRNA synthetase
MIHQPLSSSEIRSRFLEFFKQRGHAILPSASLVPENDPSVLFNTAGMQPLVPYLMGQKHPLGNRLASCQKCVRTGDLDDIGDNRHFSFFEMLGNWSFGDYFKDEAIAWSYEFLTDKEEGLGLDPARLAVTIFEGDTNAPFDQESKDIWMSLGIPEHRIYALPADDNWWSPGDNGPCGPCSEMFYDMQGEYVGKEISHAEFLNLINQEKFIEIWNDVFMEYEKKDGKVIGKLSQKNVDTGAGLERLTAVMQGKDTAYETDIFIDSIIIPATDITPEREVSSWFGYFKDLNNGKYYNEKSARIVLDHVRTATFMIADGVLPSNKDRGYILRRLIRRAIQEADKLGFIEILTSISNYFILKYFSIYPELRNDIITKTISEEELKFQKALGDVRQKIMKTSEIKNFDTKQQAKFLFELFQSFGSPLEFSISDILTYHGVVISNEAKNIFNKLLTEHQELSRSGAEQKFKGGLGGTSDKIIRSHTAHHLLLAALRQVLGEHVHQRGSNINDERIRIDFAHDAKMTDEQKSEVEKLVNQWIVQDLPMQRVEMPRSDAEQIGAEMEFGVKYPDMVSVYFIGDNLDHAISKEFCGGPHIDHTGLIGTFKIQKEEASSAGVRRIKAVIE